MKTIWKRITAGWDGLKVIVPLNISVKRSTVALMLLTELTWVIALIALITLWSQ
jgi:hypothetical protein